MNFLRSLRLAVAFLTVVPLPGGDGAITEANLARSRFAYPIVGALIGLALAGLSAWFSWVSVPPLLASFLLLAAGVAITGGLHLDGVADTFDGLFLAGGPARRLEVLRDPHVGSFGVAALVLTLLGQFAALGTLAGRDRSLGLLGAAVAGRCAALVAAGAAGYARAEGTGRILVEATTPRDALAAATLSLAVGFGTRRLAGLVAAAVAVGLAWGLARLASRRLGGVTGDLLGAAVALGELAFLLGLALGVTAR
jgi:adenosylcobinamide-GDP ribazoletransferase